MRVVMAVIPPDPLLPEKLTAMICPLPVNGFVLTIATLMSPGLLVFAAIIAPDTRDPWLTDGEEREPLS